MLEDKESRLEIGGIDYRVLYPYSMDDGSLGETDVGNSTIYVVTGETSVQKQQQTLIHEALHAMLHEAGLDDSVNDESLVLPLGNMLYQFIKNNELNFKETK